MNAQKPANFIDSISHLYSSNQTETLKHTKTIIPTIYPKFKFLGEFQDFRDKVSCTSRTKITNYMKVCKLAQNQLQISDLEKEKNNSQFVHSTYIIQLNHAFAIIRNMIPLSLLMTKINWDIASIYILPLLHFKTLVTRSIITSLSFSIFFGVLHWFWYYVTNTKSGTKKFGVSQLMLMT